MNNPQPRPYDSAPRYPAVGGAVESGWTAIADALPATPAILAIDGPAILDWAALLRALGDALDQRGIPVTGLDIGEHMAPWQDVVRHTSSSALTDDPDFEKLADGSLRGLFAALPRVERPAHGITVVHGPGASLVPHDLLWYADLPKRYAEAAVAAGRGRNLGQRDGDGPATTKRLFYIDWPLLDRHRETLLDRVDRWLDCRDLTAPASLDGVVLRRTTEALAARPFRTRPTFNTTPWGGHWGQRELGFNPDAPNTALGYELIAPESGVLLGDEHGDIEFPFQSIVSRHPAEIMGPRVHEEFGTSFPIRFDYLDTVGGGNLSVHCHPQDDYMREVFGWPYTQHETYYMMVAGEGGEVFLGLRDDADVDAFSEHAHQAHHHEESFAVEKYVQTFPAEPHQLYVIPAGTPHASGEGNVVLEVSATPYLYSLRFYDWLRRDKAGRQRPVHLGHAFRNLGTQRTGEAVRDELVPAPVPLREGPGWREETLGTLPEMFFEVRRICMDGDRPAHDDTEGRFHILNVVEGTGVHLTTALGHEHTLAYAETLVVPASVGAYELRPMGTGPVRVVKSLVR
ncbi:class I mannose-6-phosphate isomerase [Streptomyces antimycoticus]|uniref:Mannose-6-phosphate isomerase n=1 Tax=Streptomyces antimycoticus TaxID=68175 RepID=A0A4D4K283_9ACTN|nr:class I mannose-6-phosphate isomerase [Streptomyces antimycoticus]GDY40023.1 hypothetical protein SANT12839_009050 [Streptomyces antimycoticus]